MIVDPESAGKILAAKGSEIIPCEECMTCFATIGRGAAMACKVNRNLPNPDKPEKIATKAPRHKQWMFTINSLRVLVS